MGWAQDFGIGLGFGVALSLGGLAAIRWILARRRGEVPPTEVPDAALGRAPGSRPARSPEPQRPPPSTTWSWPGVAPPSLAYSGTDPAEGPPAGAPVLSFPDPRSPGAAQQVALSRRIVLHLFSLGRRGPDDVGVPEATQRGICAALAAEQSAVSKVLRRLEAAKVVVSSRRHVRGMDRRLNVYALTRSGELVAHEILARNAPADAGSVASMPRAHRGGSLPVTAPGPPPLRPGVRPAGSDGPPHLVDRSG